MKAFIAGPMRGHPEFNFPAFFKAEAEIKAAGLTTYNPARHDEQHGFPWRDAEGTVDELIANKYDLKAAFKRNMNQLATCDAIVLLKGWHESAGAYAEAACARFLGLEFIMEQDDEEDESVYAEQELDVVVPPQSKLIVP